MRLWIAVLFTISGAAALAHEITWTRLLTHVLGNTSHSVSIVLGSFMLGFCIGGVLGGRLADKTATPVRMYGWLQGILAAFAFAFPYLLAVLDHAASAAPGSAATGDFIRRAGAFTLLLVPTVAMGATFPLVARAVIPSANRAGSGAGLLFGCNLLGAALGAAAAGFVAIRALGITGTIWTAALLNALVAVCALVTASRVGRPDTRDDSSGIASPEGRGDGAVILAFAVAGFSSIGLQVVWSRILTFFLEGFTFTFTAIVCVYLTGMFVGSWALGALCRLRPRAASAGLLSALAAGAALSGLAALGFLERFPDGPESLRFTLGSAPGSTGFAVGLFLAALLFLIVPTACFGGMMPVAARLVVRSSGTLGSRLGLLYGTNNLGACVGALAAGFGVLALAGNKGALVVFCGCGMVAAWLPLAAGGSRGRRSRLVAALALGIAFVGLAAWVRPARPLILSSHIFRGSRGPEHVLVECRDGSACTVSVVDNLRTRERFLYTDDFLAAGTGWRYQYMRLLGHLPALLCDRRETALVIGFGSGTTAGALGTHPFREIRIVEISPEVIGMAGEFTDVNRGVLDDPRVRTEIGDGRHSLVADAARYDVITLEPLMPYTPGAVSLYTADFYRLGRRRLRDGGILCQWLPVHAMSSEHFRMLIRTFADVFPHASLWFYEQSLVLIGSMEATRVPVRTLMERADETAVREDLERSGIESPAAVLGGFVTAEERLRTWLGDGPSMTDDRPEMEFHPLPRSMVTTYGADNLVSLHDALIYPGPFLDLEGVGDRDVTESRLRRASRSTALVMAGMADESLRSFLALTGRTAEAGERLVAAMQLFAEALKVRPENRQAQRHFREARYSLLFGDGIRALAAGDGDRAVASLEGARDLFPERPLARYHLALAYLRQGDDERAIAELREADQRFPRHAQTLWKLAWLLRDRGDGEGARETLDRAKALDPTGALDPGSNAAESWILER